MQEVGTGKILGIRFSLAPRSAWLLHPPGDFGADLDNKAVMEAGNANGKEQFPD